MGKFIQNIIVRKTDVVLTKEIDDFVGDEETCKQVNGEGYVYGVQICIDEFDCKERRSYVELDIVYFYGNGDVRITYPNPSNIIQEAVISHKEFKEYCFKIKEN